MLIICYQLLLTCEGIQADLSLRERYRFLLKSLRPHMPVTGLTSAVSFLAGLLHPEAADRMSLNDAMQHSFLRDE